MEVSGYKPIIAVDFDGTIHSYHKGWHDGTIYGHVVPRFFSWLVEAVKHFNVTIVSSRISDTKDASEIAHWLQDQWYLAVRRGEVAGAMPMIAYSTTRPPAVVTIDDRALTFRGDWQATQFEIEVLQHFRPWHTPG